MGETFVNPYTFVPFSEVRPHRCPPQGHLGRGDLLSGKVTVTITAETPLLVRDITPSEDDKPAIPRRPDGTPMIPGSSLKGALRSLHETLAGGCLRVFNGEFVPGYRDPTSPESIGTVRMAVVKRHDNEDTPPVLQLCDDQKTPRLHQDKLARLHREEGPLISGDRLRVDFDQDGEPVEAHRDDSGEWVVFLTDANARDRRRPYHAHIRKLPKNAEEQEVPDEVWRKFRAALEGADDLRTARLQERDEQHPFAEVTFRYQPKGGKPTELVLGERHLASPRLLPGQPVWVRTNRDGEITELRLAMIWRHLGEHSAGERVPPDLLPCEDDRNLCPSCRLFGSADTSGKDTPAAQQHSYRGHVRVGDALAVDEVAPLIVTLPPMGPPRPGAGQFYLVNDAKTRGNASKPPLREWGSAADAGSPRQLRGRKYYWHTPLGEEQLPRRGTARKHQLGLRMSTKAAVFPRGTRFTATLTFTDLDEIQLGGLLACLQPGQLLGEQLWQHIGGGRPLGYGSCTLELDLDRSAVWRSGARYGAASEPVSLEPERFLEAFREWVRRELPGVHRTWPLVAKVLRPDAVDPAKVWYPPGASWDKLGEKEFDEGYEFWKRTRGMEMRSKDGVRTSHPLTPLPELSSPDQSLPLITSDAGKGGSTAVELPNQSRLPHGSKKGKN